jgi:hypothetical protein
MAVYGLVTFCDMIEVMKQIQLTQGKQALVDDADYPTLNRVKWYALAKGPQTYAVHSHYEDGKKAPTRWFMHRVILQLKKGQIGDHINGNGLDNRRRNLRKATRMQNAQNRRNNRNNTSGYKGVYWFPSTGRWRARIQINNRQISLGIFDTPEEAATMYQLIALAHFGDFARI